MSWTRAACLCRAPGVVAVVALAAVGAGAAGCAQGQGPVSHGQVFGGDSGQSTPDATSSDDGAADASPADSGVADTSPVDARSPDSGGPGDSAAPKDSGAVDAPEPVDSMVAPPVDSALPPSDGSVCASTIAVVGGSATAAFGATSHGAAWTVSTLSGTAASVPAIVAVTTGTGGFHTVFHEASTNALAYSVYTSASSSWSALAPIGAALTIDIPSLATVGADLHLVYRGSDSKFYHGIFSAGAWDGATDPVSSGGNQSFGPSAPSAAGAGGDLVIAQDGMDMTLYDQTWSTTWQAAVQHPTATVGTVAPTLVAPNGGAYDLVVVFVHENDFKLYWFGRASGAWSAPALIDPNAFTNYPVALAAMPGGQLVMVYEGSNLAPYFSLFSPTPTAAWTPPAALVASNPTLPSPPAVASGVCGYDAVAVYAGGGPVQVVTLSLGTWSAPSSLTGGVGTTGATYAAVATSP